MKTLFLASLLLTSTMTTTAFAQHQQINISVDGIAKEGVEIIIKTDNNQRYFLPGAGPGHYIYPHETLKFHSKTNNNLIKLLNQSVRVYLKTSHSNKVLECGKINLKRHNSSIIHLTINPSAKKDFCHFVFK